MKKKGFTLVELLVVIAIIALLMGILMPALARVRQIAFRMVCGTNLAGIGKAMLIYANDYDDEMPCAGGPTTQWSATIPNYAATTRAAAYGLNSTGAGGNATITASFYLLVKYAEVTPKSFICKGDSSVSEFQPGNNVDLLTLWDFGQTGVKFCSYSYHQPYKDTNGRGFPLTTSSDPGMAVAADPNPWLDAEAVGSSRVWANFAVTGGKEFTKMGNSITHQDEGQNVLFLDSHVNFEDKSFCAINEDNIYTQALAAEVRKGTQPASGGTVPISRQDNLLSMDYGSGSAKGRACFLADTPVCINGQTMQIASVTDEKLEAHEGTWECRDIALESGNTISVVESHLFMLNSGIWVHAQDLRSGMTLRTQSGSVAIKSVTTRTYTGMVYNVNAANSDQYLVGQDSVVVRDW
ncbi:MAG: prepilin-type N-terminal cleavage/methylation domain-containing protein [Sedimentisphaerales bacterium]|nr:prepilin-type N-terminal cleavage/methylation domain-containing protein [Sedimentisphaerales bacterium]